jgi:hypothetical protein
VVNVGVTLQTARGDEITHDFHHQPVVPYRTQPIPPGAKATTPMAPPTPQPGRYRLRMQMVAEGVGWFGPTATVDLTVRPAG